MQFQRFQISVTRIAVLSFTRRGAIDDFHRWAWQIFFFLQILHIADKTWELITWICWLKPQKKDTTIPRLFVNRSVKLSLKRTRTSIHCFLQVKGRTHTNLFYQSVVTRWFPILINLSEKTWNNGLLDMIVVPGIVCIVLPASASLSRRPPRSDRFFHTLPNTRTHYSVCNCLLTMLLIDKSTQKWEQNNASASRSPGRPISSLLVNMFLIRS